MFISKKNLENELLEVKKAAQIEFNDIIKAWHEQYALKQNELKSKFDWYDVDTWSVNVWDEINQNNDTFIFVEMNEVPDDVCFAVLNHIYRYLHSHDVSNVSFRFYDATSNYPINLLTETGRYTSFKRWELLLEDVTYESLNEIIELLKKVPQFNEKTIDVYSES